MGKETISTTLKLDLDISEFSRNIRIVEDDVDRLLDKVKKLKEATESVKLTPTPQIKMPVVIAPRINMDEIIDEIMRRLKDAIKNIGPGIYT